MKINENRRNEIKWLIIILTFMIILGGIVFFKMGDLQMFSNQIVQKMNSIPILPSKIISLQSQPSWSISCDGAECYLYDWTIKGTDLILTPKDKDLKDIPIIEDTCDLFDIKGECTNPSTKTTTYKYPTDLTFYKGDHEQVLSTKDFSKDFNENKELIFDLNNCLTNICKIGEESITIYPTGGYWVANTTINTGLIDVGDRSTPNVFYKDSTWYMISGNTLGGFFGFNWTGSAWQRDPNINASLPDIGSYSKPSVFYKDSTWYLISGESIGGFFGFNWTGSAWQGDKNINASLGDIGVNSAPNVFYKDSTWYMIPGSEAGLFFGFNWTGSAWQPDKNIKASLLDIGNNVIPSVFYKDSIWYMIVGHNPGTFFGFRYVEENVGEYSSTNTNVTNEGGYSHLNISTDSPYNKLLAYYSFDGDLENFENAKAFDLSNNNYDAYGSGYAIYNSTYGEFGNGVYLSSGQNVKNDNIPVTQGNLTINFWVNFTGSASGRYVSPLTTSTFDVISNAPSGNGCGFWGIYQLYTMKFSCQKNTTAGYDVTAGSYTPTVNVWYMFTGTYDKDTGTVVFYVNGSLIDSGTNDNVTSITGDGIKIGANSAGYHIGTIDEVMIFNRSLSGQEITDIYNNQSARFKPTGYQDFVDVNVSAGGNDENYVNVSIPDCQRLFNSNLSATLGTQSGGAYSYTENTVYLNDTCSANNLEVAENPENVSLRIFYEAGNSTSLFYTPYVIGNITLEGYTIGAPPIDTCTYDVDNWTIQASDFCNITTNTDLGNNWFICSTSEGNGYVNIYSNITSASVKLKFDGCNITIMNGGGFI